MNKQTDMDACPKCGKIVGAKFCSECGTPQKLHRIDGQYILSEIGSVLNFEKGILHTIKELLFRPGKNVRIFIHNDRTRLVKPLIFIIICSLTYTIAEQILHFEEGYVMAGGFGESAIATIFAWIQSNYGYANLIMAIFIAIWTKVFFRKYEYNFFEIIILLCFVIGIGMLIYTVFGILESFLKIQVLHIGGMVAFIYASWAIGRFFDKTVKTNYLKGFISYLLGMITFYIIAVAVGFCIDMIHKAF